MKAVRCLVVFCCFIVFLHAEQMVFDTLPNIYTPPQDVIQALQRSSLAAFYVSLGKLKPQSPVELSLDVVDQLISKTINEGGKTRVSTKQNYSTELVLSLSLLRTDKMRNYHKTFVDFRFSFFNPDTGEEIYKSISTSGEGKTPLEAQKIAWDSVFRYIFVSEEFKRINTIQVSTKPIAKTEAQQVIETLNPLSFISDVNENIPVVSKQNPHALAIVFGVEDYKNIPKVQYAYRDAYYIKEYFKNSMGIPAENIYYKTNDGVTKGEFDKVFSAGGWLSKRITNNESEVYVYFAGHGAPSLKDEKPYLIPYDGDINYAAQTGYALEKLLNDLSELKAKSTVVFLDACFSGMNRESQPLLADARPIAMEVKFPSLIAGVNVLSATSSKQISSGYSAQQHGLFSYYLMKAMRGEADSNSDKKVSLAEIYDYVRVNVARSAQMMDREQTPQMQGLQPDLIIMGNR